MNECVLCDWHIVWTAQSVGVYLTEEAYTPLRWPGTEAAPRPCSLADGLAETLPEVALVAHWAQEHPAQLTGALGHDRWYLKPI
jgi:hypothetical protein